VIKRFEYKYLIPEEQLGMLKQEILPFLEIDPNAGLTGRNEYTVRSLYYDTSGYRSYFEKVEGVAFRKKFRLRVYNEQTENSKVFLEIKNKKNNCIDKNRASIEYSLLEKVLAAGSLCDISDSDLRNGGREDAEKFLYHYRGANLHPTVLVVYEREAYMGKFDNSLRITLDKNLRSRINADERDLFNNNDIKNAIPYYFIMEFKFYGKVPAWFKFVTVKFNLTRKALSKYTMCIDSHIKNEMVRLYNQKLLISSLKGNKNIMFKRNLL
jgi:hypothetical protein